MAREARIVAGLDVAAEVFRRVHAEIHVQKLSENGAQLLAGDDAMELRGRASSLLSAERTALNFLQRLSGVASLAGEYSPRSEIPQPESSIRGTQRPECGSSTSALFAAGEGVDHRSGLHDMVMVKDNHLAAQTGWRNSRLRSLG